MPRFKSVRMNKHARAGNFLTAIDELKSRVSDAFARKVEPASLDVLTQDLGTVVNGEFIALASTATSSEPTDTGFTGVFMSGNGYTFGGTVYHWGIVASGVLQVGGNDVAEFLAGAGAVKLNANGVEVVAPTDFNDINSYKTVDSGGNTLSALMTKDTGGGVSTRLYVDGGSQPGYININADGTSAVEATISIGENSFGVIYDGSATKIILNNAQIDLDTYIYGNSASKVIMYDAANGRLGVNNVSPATALDVTGTITATGGIDNTNGHIRSFTATLNDDSATSFLPTKSAGIILFSSQNSTNWGMIFYNTAAPSTVAINVGSNTNVTTGALAGTTGTDGKFTVSAHATDGKLYFENRSGGSRTIYVTLF